MAIKTVAFIGAGLIGTPMARLVHAAGFELIVCDRIQAVLNAFNVTAHRCGQGRSARGRTLEANRRRRLIAAPTSTCRCLRVMMVGVRVTHPSRVAGLLPERDA